MTTQLLLLAAFVASMLLMSFNYGKRKKKIIFFGDSITEFGVRRGGYITRLKDYFKQEGLDEKFDLVAAGIGGNKVYDLYLRINNDVIVQDPAIVVVFVGVNDVWQQLLGTGTDPENFEAFYNMLIQKLISANIKVVICTPAVIGEKKNNANELDEELNKYSTIIKNIAAANQLPLVDLRQAFVTYNALNNIENKEAGILTTDKVHLNDKGNQLVAEEIWKVLKEV
jgi:lysophospholipase L1-like esterase